jgi:integrase
LAPCRRQGYAIGTLRPTFLGRPIRSPLHEAWRFIGSWGKEAALLNADPAKGIKGPKRKETAGHPPWTADEIDAYRARWPIGTIVRAAMELLFLTGARISYGILIGPQHVDRDGVLTFIHQKTGEPAHVPLSG